MPNTALFESSVPGVTALNRGKVRDMYDLGEHLLMVATDRISAYDVVLASAIPDKGKVLTQLSAYWFHDTREIVPNHMVSTDPTTYPEPFRSQNEMLQGRSMLVLKTEPIRIECVARGYLSGSGWKEYLETGQVCGIKLPSGLKESERLPQPIFTPATKADTGHDINISEADAADLIGHDLVTNLRELTLSLYLHGANRAAQQGIIVADTKFEFGLLSIDGATSILLIDEILTPDSSRFWPQTEFTPGGTQPSFDKQYVRDYLDQVAWNRTPPAPSLPEAVINNTQKKYLEAFRLLTGREL